MMWDRPILTDSGGYQIFSLAKLRKITNEGVQFQNHVDGTPAFISPEIAMEIQAALGSDIAMVLDEGPPWPCEYDYAAQSNELTIAWAQRCKRYSEENAQRPTPNAERLTTEPGETPARTEEKPTRQLVFGIVQGATFEELRKQCAQALVDLDFDGYAIGGGRVGGRGGGMVRAGGLRGPSLPAGRHRY